MLNNLFTSRRLIGGGWVIGTGLIVTVSAVLGASLSTTAIVLALCVTPGIVVAVLARSAPATSVSQILYSLETKDRRS